MALVANGARLVWDRYEFGVHTGRGTIKCDSLEQAQAMAAAEDGEVVMAAIYRTGWMETL